MSSTHTNSCTTQRHSVKYYHPQVLCHTLLFLGSSQLQLWASGKIALTLVTGYPMVMLLRFLVDLSKYQFPLDSRPWTYFSISLQPPSMCLPYVHLWKSHLNATPESPSCLVSTPSVLCFFLEPHRVCQNGFILDETSLKVAASPHWRGWLWI